MNIKVNIKYSFFAIVAMIIIISSCTKEEIVEQYNVDSAFEPYVQKFISESNNPYIETNKLILVFADEYENSESKTYANHYEYQDGILKVMIYTKIWNNYSWEQREWLIFSSLGKVILKREDIPDTDILPNGDKKSMMCNPSSSRMWAGDNIFKRDFYIKELFNPSTPLPEWASDTEVYMPPNKDDSSTGEPWTNSH